MGGKVAGNNNMKKIIIIDGGPRRNMNTAALCDAFAEGAKGVSPEIEVERVRLYDLPPFRGCVSCLACKLKGRETGFCAVRDSLTDTLRAVNAADGLVIASPIYFSEWTAVTRAFLERLVFPWLSYEDFSCAAPTVAATDLKPSVAIVSCNDGLRPVIMKLEATDEESKIDYHPIER